MSKQYVSADNSIHIHCIIDIHQLSKGIIYMYTSMMHIHLFEQVQSGGSVSGGEEFHDAGHDPALVLSLLQQPAQSEERGQDG